MSEMNCLLRCIIMACMMVAVAENESKQHIAYKKHQAKVACFLLEINIVYKCS